jgi:hypothetical protein
MSGLLLKYGSVYVAEAPGAVGLVPITNDAPLEEAIARQLVRARLGQLCKIQIQPPTLRHGIQKGQPSLAVLLSVQEAFVPWPYSFAEGQGSAIVQISPEDAPSHGQRPAASAYAACNATYVFMMWWMC